MADREDGIGSWKDRYAKWKLKIYLRGSGGPSHSGAFLEICECNFPSGFLEINRFNVEKILFSGVTMNAMIISYLIAQAGERPVAFFRRWYVDFTRRYWAAVVEHAGAIEKMFAIKLTLRLIWQPLYGDYSIVGRIIGPILRCCRIIAAFMVLIVYFGIALAIWFLWTLMPLYLLWLVIRN